MSTFEILYPMVHSIHGTGIFTYSFLINIQSQSLGCFPGCDFFVKKILLAHPFDSYEIDGSSMPKMREKGCRKKSSIHWLIMEKYSVDAIWLVVEPTHLKNTSQIGNLPQIGVNIKNI